MAEELPAELQDEYGKIKIALAASVVGIMGGVVLGVAFGAIDAGNEVAKVAVPVFTTLAGVAVAFFFKNGVSAFRK